MARVARKLGLPAKVYMPERTVIARVKAVQLEGAEVFLIPGSYDDALTQLSEDATRNGWLIISDTGWEGYEEIPELIMLGYTVLMAEAAFQWGDVPDVVIVQAGCGGLACSVLSWLLHKFEDSRPFVITCEAQHCACVLESMRARRQVTIQGELNTIMAGLSCGAVSSNACETLLSGLDGCMSITDDDCKEAMRVLANPCEGDPAVIAGESGAAGLAALSVIMRQEQFAELRGALKLNALSRVLVVNTEGITDPVNYAKIFGMEG